MWVFCRLLSLIGWGQPWKPARPSEFEDQMLAGAPKFYDFIHTVLPTALPLEDSYEQYFRLYTKSIPLRNVFSFMSKYRLKDVPANLAKFRRWSKRLRTLHTDYVMSPRRIDIS